jgi:hypothetical protein
MSAAAHQVLTPKQIEQLEKPEILSSSLDTIEACGGSDVMMLKFS